MHLTEQRGQLDAFYRSEAKATPLQIPTKNKTHTFTKLLD